MRIPAISKLHIAGFCIAVFVWGAQAHAADFSSTNFIVKDPVLSGGGGYATSTSFRLWSSIAQPAIGLSATTSFGLRAGFLYFPEPSTAASPSPSPSPSPSGAPSDPISATQIVRRIIEVITPKLPGEEIPLPAECPERRRSDFNCDGKVNLQDLSIFFAYRPAAPLRSLSFVLFDWTERLPGLLGFAESALLPQAPEALAPGPARSPDRGLADVGSAVAPPPAPPASTPRGVFRNIFSAIGVIADAVFGVIVAFTKILLYPFFRLFGK